MWNKIINPKTGRKVSIYGRIGKSILHKYYLNLYGGAESKLSYKNVNFDSSDWVTDMDGYESEDIETGWVTLPDNLEGIGDGKGTFLVEPDPFLFLIKSFIAKCRTATSNYKSDCDYGCGYKDKIYKMDKYKLVSDVEFDTYFNVEELYKHLFLHRSNTYVSKRVVDNGTKIIFVGDYHSSLHSFIQHLDTWLQEGIIDEDYRISDNYIIVCTGDIIDRGPYGIELLYLFNLLIRVNEPGKCIMMKGNHETLDMYNKYGFQDEIHNQFTNNINKDKIRYFIDILPLAVFIKTVDNIKWYMFCHGGIDKSLYQPSIDRSEIGDFLNHPEQHKILNGNGTGFLWGDFSYSIENDDFTDLDDSCIWNSRRSNSRDLGIEICPSKYVQKVLDNNNIISVISGHQDTTTFGFLYRDNKYCINSDNPRDGLNACYSDIDRELCSRNNNRSGDYEYDMTSILCFVLSSAVISKFTSAHHNDIGYTISYGCLDLATNMSSIKLMETDFINQ